MRTISAARFSLENDLKFDPIDVLQCPQCEGPLRRETVALVCEGCGNQTPYRDGIIDFVQDSARTKLDDIDYDQFYRISEPAARQLVENMKESAIRHWPPSLGMVIEIGAGTGGATMGIAATVQFEHLVVTDISRKMLGLCQRNLRAANLLRTHDMTFVTYGTTQKCFRSSSFDSAVGSAVLHHITDVQAFLSDLARILKPSAVAFFVEPGLRFHRALAAMLSDIVADLMREGVRYDDAAIIRMCNWIAETRCNIINQGDLEFLATREDKHLFVAEDIEELGLSSGFGESFAQPFGADPTGEATLRTYLSQSGVEQAMIDRACAAIPHHSGKYMDLLGPLDKAPTYILGFIKTEGVRPSSERESLPNAPPPVRSYLTITRKNGGPRSVLSIGGWLVSRADVKSLVVDCGSAKLSLPVWLPRPDVQFIINEAGEIPAINALCSGVAGQIEVETAGAALDIAFHALTTDGAPASWAGSLSAHSKGKRWLSVNVAASGPA